MKTKVLIVDDEPDVLDSTAGLVESLGYEAIKVAKAAEILDAVVQEQPGVLLQDLKMPGLNVPGLVASLRSNPATADIPIVFFSANADLPDTAARLDAWGYLSKPFSKVDLAKILDEALGAPERARPAPGRAMRADVRSVFHDYWNLLTALSNYLVLLDEADDMPERLKKTVRGIDDLVLRLASTADRLQTYMVSGSASKTAATDAGSRESLAGKR